MTAPTTHRDWPSPAPGEPDFIIRDPGRLVTLSRWAASGAEGANHAKARVDNHYTAIAANLHLGVVLKRWRTSRVGGL